MYVDKAPVIDGKLDDTCWVDAARLTDYYVLDTEVPLPEETIAFIGVGSSAMYVAVVCKDRTPEDIVATETRRNGDIWSDDCVVFELDPWHQHRDLYSFRVNARGTQSDDIPGGSAAKTEWRGDWTAAATRTADGWIAEMAIPFSILRYPPDQTTFGFVISRHLASRNLWVSYPNAGRPWDQLLAADLVDLHLPTAKPQPLLMLYNTAYLDKDTRRFNAGLDVQAKLPNGLTALASLNPDYSQIEQVVEPISFSYTERYQPEVRPFFVTGGDAYLPGSRSFYSRRIEDFDLGLKVFGTIGDDTYGLLGALRYDSANSVVGAWRHQFTPDSHARLLLVGHTQVGEPDDLTYGLEMGRRRRHPNGEEQSWLTLYPNGYYELGGKHVPPPGSLGWAWRLHRVNRDYQPALGYMFDQGTQGGEINFSWSQYYGDRPLQTRSWYANLYHFPYLDGGIFSSGCSAGYTWGWRNGHNLFLGVHLGTDYGQRSSDVNGSLSWNSNDLYQRGGIFALRGTRAGGDYTYLSVSQGFRPLRKVSVNLGAEYSRLAPPSPNAHDAYQSVLTVSCDITAEKSVAARLVLRDDDSNIFAVYRQVVRRGMDAYLLLGNSNPQQHTGFEPRVELKLVQTL